MDARDWDRVPQPIRAMAFMNMVDDWVCHYGVGEGFGIPFATVTSRLKAIGMAESWFEHRAINVNPDGSRDLGLAQLSDYTRGVLGERAARGLADFALDDEDYFDPLSATRALTYWFGLMLAEASGDLDLATRAYNVGIVEAGRGGGRDYLQNVERVLRRYVRNRGPSPSWSFLFARSVRRSQPSAPCRAGRGAGAGRFWPSIPSLAPLSLPTARNTT